MYIMIRRRRNPAMTGIIKEELKDKKLRDKQAAKKEKVKEKKVKEKARNRPIANRLGRVATDSALAFFIIFGSIFGLTQILDVIKHTKENSNFDMPFDPDVSPYDKKKI